MTEVPENLASLYVSSELINEVTIFVRKKCNGNVELGMTTLISCIIYIRDLCYPEMTDNDLAENVALAIRTYVPDNAKTQ